MTDDRPAGVPGTRADEVAMRRERRLVERAAAGDGPAFAELYRLTADAVFRFVLFRVRDEAAAEDVTQEVYIRAHRGLGSLRDPDRFRSWLMRIAHNCAIDHVTRREAREETPLPPDALAWRNAVADEVGATFDPEKHAEHVLNLQSVLDACAHLTELQRQVVALRFVGGLSVAETAAIMGRSPNAIHNLQHHALAGLRRLLLPADDEVSE